MIISENSKPEIIEFRNLMQKTDNCLNAEAKGHEKYFQSKTALDLELVVCDVLSKCAKGTAFENSIIHVGGAQFPDIVAGKYYGVEVKSTIKNHWTSTGSSILESTRIKDIERIFMTFGKLGSPVEFKSKPYEECLSEIAVTHYPRYKIDMNLKKGETIFDKMGISYDELRKLENPVAPVSRYYKAKLKPGERLWWSADSETDFQEESVPPTIRFFSSLLPEEKDICIAQIMTFFPEIFGNDRKKYDQPSLWLLTEKSVFNTHIRDNFSAGGQELMQTSQGNFVNMPALYRNIEKYRDIIVDTLTFASISILFENWKVKVESDRLLQWCKLCSEYYAQGDRGKYFTSMSVLKKVFSIYEINDKIWKVADSNSVS